MTESEAVATQTGYRDFGLGVELEGNPFPPRSPQARRWEEAWKDAEREQQMAYHEDMVANLEEDDEPDGNFDDFDKIY